ncbi:hypothetical protein GCM10010973_38430 [Cribrihabitans marinus]|nr:hypothetical protein GCM10010973_38430 [Cribrihabitans marinus]
MRKRASDRAAIADGGVGDVRNRVLQEWRMSLNLGISAYLSMTCQRTNPQSVTFDSNAGQLTDFRDIDQQISD